MEIERNLVGAILHIKETMTRRGESEVTHWYFDTVNWLSSGSGLLDEVPDRPMSEDDIDWVKKHHLSKICSSQQTNPDPYVGIDKRNHPILSALVHVDGYFVTAASHAQGLMSAINAGIIKTGQGQVPDMDCFVTGDGRIIDRYQALEMVKSACSKMMNAKGIIPSNQRPQIWSKEQFRAFFPNFAADQPLPSSDPNNDYESLSPSM